MALENLLNIDKYVKRLNWYLQEHYPANKKISSEEWNALFLALMRQGNLQEETLEKICNDYLPLQINKINAIISATKENEQAIQRLREDTADGLQQVREEIPKEYLKDATVQEGVLTLIKQDNNSVNFFPGSGIITADVKDGDLILCYNFLDDAVFSINDEGYMQVELGGDV